MVRRKKFEFKDESYWRYRPNIWSEAFKFLKEHPECCDSNNIPTMPGFTTLRKIGYEELAFAIKRFYNSENGVFHFDSIWESIYLKKPHRQHLYPEIIKHIKRRYKGLTKMQLQEADPELYKYANKRGLVTDSIIKGILMDKKHRVMNPNRDLEFAIGTSKEFFNKNSEYSTLPGHDILEAKDFTSLARAIKQYHGGFPKFRLILAERIGTSLPSDSFDNFVKHYLNE